MTRFILLLALLVTACAQNPKAPGAGGTQVSQVATTYISTLPSRGIDYSATLQRIAFSSCANQDEPQPLWKTISATQPDLFLFAGDNVYASSPYQQPIAEQYRKLDLISEYRSLREKVPFMATWDDHDFGMRDGGNDWAGKDAARKDFVNYWTYTRNSMPLEQGGVYHSKIIGPKKHMVQVIMLDTRYYRSSLKEKTGFEGKAMNYEPSNEGTVLGEHQWEWLETQLKRPADVRLIVSSIQVIAEDPPFEKWGNFPKERQRLFDLIKKTKAKNVVILSGDRHMASISKMDLPGYGALYDITGSSINRANNYKDADRHYVGAVYNKENFGLAEIDWKRKSIKVDIRDMQNEVVNSVTIKLK
ncbi:alkaline phosphatase D family protein [Bdellovibrio bacteriovorus]|uniref:alkaline phosphatase D family protein n=1 Tax=Bdellovibrio bacteriovorus TaxID=959 RepID=UPI0035A5EA49